MSSTDIVPRHYPKIPELIRRDTGELSQEALDSQVFGRAMLEKMIQAGPREPKLVSSAHGTISHILLTIPGYAVRSARGEANPLASAYEDLLAKLPPTIRFTVLTHGSVAGTVEQWFTAAGFTSAQIVSVPDHLHFSVWAEDGYVVAEDAASNETFLIEPFEFPRYADGLMADFASNSTALSHTQAPLYFQGGNVLIGDDFFLIGADYPANTMKYIDRVIMPGAGEAPVDAIHRLYREYMDANRTLHYVGSTVGVPSQTTRPIVVDGEPWTEVLYMGNKPGTVQPLFHIDMFISLAGRDASGRYQVLVGDPGLAATALGVPLWPHAMQEVFDSVATGLQRLGFAVTRNPLPLVYVDDGSERTRIWYFATSNNALVQIPDSGEKRVWLPAYGFGNWTSLTVTDTANRELWESLGFTATLLSDFHPFAENLGAVHCIKKYLGRG
ncbi:MAG: hypothetical protein ABWY26_02820 [Microbacterium sp.]